MTMKVDGQRKCVETCCPTKLNCLEMRMEVVSALHHIMLSLRELIIINLKLSILVNCMILWPNPVS